MRTRTAEQEGAVEQRLLRDEPQPVTGRHNARPVAVSLLVIPGTVTLLPYLTASYRPVRRR